MTATGARHYHATDPNPLRRRRAEAGVTLAEAAVRARTSPTTTRLFELGLGAQLDPVIVARLEKVYDGFQPSAGRRVPA